jgi:hypothetical protein
MYAFSRVVFSCVGFKALPWIEELSKYLNDSMFQKLILNWNRSEGLIRKSRRSSLFSITDQLSDTIKRYN